MVVRFPAGPRINLKSGDQPKGRWRRPKKNQVRPTERQRVLKKKKGHGQVKCRAISCQLPTRRLIFFSVQRLHGFRLFFSVLRLFGSRQVVTQCLCCPNWAFMAFVSSFNMFVSSFNMFDSHRKDEFANYCKGGSNSVSKNHVTFRCKKEPNS